MSMNMNVKTGGAFGSKMNPQAAAPRSLWSSLKRLLSYMRKSTLLIFLTLFVAIAGTIMQVLTPRLMGGATTIIFTGVQAETGIDFSSLLIVLMKVGILYLGVFLSAFLQERLMTVVSLRTTETLRNAVKGKLNHVPVAYFDKYSTGDMMSVAVNDIDNIAQNLQQSLTQLISSVILVVGTLVIMLTISPLLTVLAGLIVPATMVIAKVFTPAAQKQNKKYFASMGEMNGSIEETYKNFMVIKAFNGEAEAMAAFQKPNEELCQSGWKAKFFGSSMMHFMMLVQNAVYVLIAALGALRVMDGTLVIGNLQAFLQYSQQFSSPVAKLSGIWSGLLSAIASAERVFAVLDADEMIEYKSQPPCPEDTAKVTFDNVQFGYDDALLMKGFSLTVEAGETVAIVGHTGAGKTTLVNLLERFYETKSGVIRLEGNDIRSLTHDELRSRIGMVLQDTWLFSGTIYENIKYGNANATAEEVYRAAKAAYANEFIQKLPDGYGTVLQEDAGNISQGQRQLITIARAFLANPEIRVLDEATSNVDSRTEMIVQKAMKKLMAGRTSFVIAHRLSTIYDADRIIVMEKGDIVEAGKHIELIAKDGTYADIYNSQFKIAV